MTSFHKIKLSEVLSVEALLDENYRRTTVTLKGDKMLATMLGSGRWEGALAPFCRCKLCRMASKNTLSVENRMRPSFYVEAKNTHFMMEIGPDLRRATKNRRRTE